MKKMEVWVVVVALIAIITASIFIFRSPNQTKPPVNLPKSATIKYSDNGFQPENVDVASGAKVTITNTSSQTLDFASGPHPEHTDDPELNTGEIQPGQSRTITVTNKGTWSFHNHLDATQAGTLVVE